MNKKQQEFLLQKFQVSGHFDFRGVRGINISRAYLIENSDEIPFLFCVETTGGIGGLLATTRSGRVYFEKMEKDITQDTIHIGRMRDYGVNFPLRN